MCILNEFFEKIYYVNLERRPDRNQECLDELNKYGIIAERFNAVDAKDLNLKPWMGCLLSNLEIIKRAKDNGFKSVLILEDDVTFNDNFDQLFNSYISQVPDNWNMLYLSGNHNEHGGYQVNKISENIIKCFLTYSTHSFAINSSVYDLIINYLTNNQTKPVDVLYTDIQRMCNAYSFLPGLTNQRVGFSDIENNIVDHRKYIK
jgi:GR25 family glycosyltransferase involved in LPS biosynthesis